MLRKMKFATFLLLLTFVCSGGQALAAMSDAEFCKLCETGSYEQIEAAINGGANVNARGAAGATALMWAVEGDRNPKVISLLLKKGADVNGRSTGGATALMWAAQINKNPEILSLLLENGADVNAKNSFGSTALHVACKSNLYADITNVKLLLKAGADPNARNGHGMTPLMITTMHFSNHLILRFLLDYGANPDALDDFGNKAGAYSRVTAVKYLLDVHGKGRVQKPPLEVFEFVELCQFATPEVLENAILDGVDVNQRNDWGGTCIGEGVYYNLTDIIPALLKHGADISAEDGMYSTPLMKAVHRGSSEFVLALLEHGADPNVQTSNYLTALEKAEMEGKTELVEILRKCTTKSYRQ